MNNLMLPDILNVRKKMRTETTDQYSVVFLPYPENCSAVVNVMCDTALLVPQIDYGTGMSFRCFGNLNTNQLNPMIEKTINVTIYYI